MKAKLLFFNTNKLIIIIILIFFCLISVSSNSKKIIHKFNNISDVTFSDESDIVIFKNSYLYGKPGQPLLPYTNIKILLPLDADFSSININLDNLEEVIFSKKVNILPAQPPIYDGTPTWPTGSNIVDGIDMDVYSVDSYSPSKYIKTSCTGKLRQWKIVEITLVPYQYNPIQKRLKKLVNAEIVIEYKVIDTVIRSSLKTLNKKNITPIEVKTMDKVKNMVVNFLDVNSTYGDTLLFQPSKSAVETITGNSKYVIITTSAIASSSDMLDDFILSKQARGFDVLLIDETQWGGGTGMTASLNIRAWLLNNYESQDIEYVLLIGNPHPDNGDIPMLKCNYYNISTIYVPTDFCYAELSGNWDRDGDGKYGEWIDDFGSGGVDRFAEISVGRIPFYQDIYDLDKILTKITDYENEIVDECSWRYNTLLPMKPTGPENPSYQLGEQIKNNTLIPNGIDYHRIYDDDYNLNPPPETIPCTITNVLDVWQNNHFGAIVWKSHGSSGGASGIIGFRDTYLLNDIYPGHVFQASCSNALPEYSDNLSYSLLKNGCISSIGATRDTFSWIGESNYTYAPSCGGFAYQYAKYIIGNGFPVGDGLNEVKNFLTPNDAGQWAQWCLFNLYGCPSVGLYTIKDNNDIPFDVTISNQDIYEDDIVKARHNIYVGTNVNIYGLINVSWQAGNQIVISPDVQIDQVYNFEAYINPFLR